MLINNLNIQNFRGIPGSLQLDLSAPITVFYAPNGTGKTSICDAAEWMLCGHVGRLNTLDSSEVRCRFGDVDIETHVEATFADRGKPYALKRILEDSGSVLQRKIGMGEYSKVTDRELLSMLVDAIPPSGSSPKGQISWVRSTRFLESDSLNLLIDSDTEASNTRKLIFSNLFGVGEFQKAENNLNKILGRLSAASTIKKEKIKISEKIAEYDVLIAKLANDQEEPYRDHALNLLYVIAKYLRFPVGLEEGSSVREYYNELEVEFVKSAESLQSKISARSFVRDKMYLYQEKISKKDKLNKTLSLEGQELKKLDKDFSKNKKNLDDQKKRLETNEYKVRDIEETLEVLNITHQQFSRLNETYGLPLLEGRGGGGRLEELNLLVTSKKKKLIAAKERINNVERCIEKISVWVNAQDAIKGIIIEFDSLQSSHSQHAEEESLPERISTVRAELATFQATREKALGELDLLLTSGKKYVETHGDVSECPLCEYKYDTNLTLLRKISDRFSKLSDRSKEESVLASKYSDLTKLLEQENARLEKFKELTNRKNHLLQEISVIEDAFFGVGVVKDDHGDVASLTSKLNSIHAQLIKEVQSISSAITSYEKAYDAGKALEGMLLKQRALSAKWFESLESPNYIEPKLLDDLEKSIVSLQKLLNIHNIEENQHLEEERLNIDSNVIELAKVKAARSAQSILISSTKKTISDVNIEIDDFKKMWSLICENPVVNVQESEHAYLAIDKNISIQNEIKEMFEKVQKYFSQIREAEKNESERGTYQKELLDANVQLLEWKNQEQARSVIEVEIGAIKEEIRRFIAQEIQPLSNIINTLFLRAQGNRFINSIEARPSKEGLLEWIAELDEDGQAFDKMRSLSQGQRQDLALSIFLARARSLGGTFFLDEPLAHLDDLNRVALLDTLRIIVSEKRSVNPLRLVLTTASNNLLRHLREKFSLVEGSDGEPALRIYKMTGNPKVGLQVEPPELVRSPNRLLRAV